MTSRISEGDWCSALQLPDGTELVAECFGQQDLEEIYTIEKLAHPFPWKLSHFQDSIAASHHHCIGVRADATWIGYAIVSCVASEAELLLLVVDVHWQRRGVAQALLAHVLQRLAAHADTIFLEVRAGNERAIALYEQLEFNQVGERPNYYRSGNTVDDALIYARVLP